MCWVNVVEGEGGFFAGDEKIFVDVAKMAGPSLLLIFCIADSYSHIQFLTVYRVVRE